MASALLALIPLILKLIVMILERTKDVPAEQRRKFLESFDSAIEKAKAGDVRDLSIWFGKKL